MQVGYDLGMHTEHAPVSDTLALPSESSLDRTPLPSTMEGDPLSDVLRAVRLHATVYFLMDASTPYCVEIPHTDAYRTLLQAGAGNMMSYYVIVEGCGVATVPVGQPIENSAGDVILFPQSDSYKMGTAVDTPPELDAEETLRFFQLRAAGSLPFAIPEGVCGGANIIRWG